MLHISCKMLSVGNILKKTREKKGLALDVLEKKLRVRQKFLQAIETDNWNFFTSKIYIEGLIKNYSRIVDLDPKKMLAFFRREYEVHEEIKFKKKVASQYLTPETKKIAIFVTCLIVGFFIIYFGFQLKIFLSPPKVTLLEPKSQIFKRIDRISIVGQTEKEATVNIFGERVYQDKEGIFKYNLPLKIGKNELIIEVIGANGKKTFLKKEFVREK